MEKLIPGMRYPRLEREFMRDVLAGVPAPTARDHVHQIEQRLAKGAEEYGSSQFWVPPLRRIFEEVGEEVDDVIGWSALAAIRMRYMGHGGLVDQFAKEIGRGVVPLYATIDATLGLLGEDVERGHYPVAHLQDR